jgi:1-acyl-sn-glycerol-3-phosphate acyltransferase
MTAVDMNTSAAQDETVGHGAELLIWVRSALFALLALCWIAVLSLLYLPLLVMPRRAMQRALLLWSRGILALLRVCCGVRYRVVGRQHFRKGPR